MAKEHIEQCRLCAKNSKMNAKSTFTANGTKIASKNKIGGEISISHSPLCVLNLLIFFSMVFIGTIVLWLLIHSTRRLALHPLFHRLFHVTQKAFRKWPLYVLSIDFLCSHTISLNVWVLYRQAMLHKALICFRVLYSSVLVLLCPMYFTLHTSLVFF